MGVSKNRGTPKASVLIGFSIINHPFWGTPIFGNTHITGIIWVTCFFLDVAKLLKTYRKDAGLQDLKLAKPLREFMEAKAGFLLDVEAFI